MEHVIEMFQSQAQPARGLEGACLDHIGSLCPKKSHIKRIYILLIPLIILASFPKTINGELENIKWEDLSEHLKSESISLLELNICDCPEDIENIEAPRTVAQIIENTFYLWEEYDIVTGQDVSCVCILMKKPNQKPLSADEAQILLTASSLLTESQPKPENVVILDPFDTRLNLISIEELLVNDEQPFTPEISIGTDDRTRITNTSSYPWNTHCYLGGIQFPSVPNSYRGTGCIVTPYMVLTCGHNVYHQATNSWAENNITITPGQKQDHEYADVIRPYGTKNSAELRTNSQFIAGEQSVEYDYGAVLFNESFSEINTYMPVEFSNSFLSVGDTIYIAGYPKKVKLGTLDEEPNSQAFWEGSGEIVAMNSSILNYWVDTSGGDSGAPIRSSNGILEQDRIIGIHGGGTEDPTPVNGGVRLGQENQALITEWMQWTPFIDIPDTEDCQTINIGTETKSWVCPMYTYYHDSRTQVIYLASEIETSGLITSLALDVTMIPGQMLNNWTIRLKHTQRSSYESISDYYLDGSDWTVVYQNDEDVDSTGWRTFEFQRPFVYNGTDNLLVDFSHNNDFYTENGQCSASLIGPARSLIQFSDSEAGDPLNWSGASYDSLYYSEYIPNIRLTICDDTVSVSSKVTASDGEAADYFGSSVSISGNYMIVGAYGNDDKGLSSGSAYIFEHQGSNWIQQEILTSPDGSTFDQFGKSVSISGDYAIVGAPLINDEIGSAYIFHRQGDNWTHQKKLTTWDWDKGEGDKFGSSVGIDGDYAVIGAIGDDLGCGAAHIFMRRGSNWIQQAKLIAEDWALDDEFGCEVSISGDYVIAGAYRDNNERGAAYIFKRQGIDWTQHTKLLASDGSIQDCFGYSVALNGDYAILGAYLNDDQIHDRGSAYIFKLQGDNWIEQAKLIASDGATDDHFGKSVSICGNTAIIGAPGDYITGNIEGSVYMFKCENNRWTQQAKLRASDGKYEDNFGSTLSISSSYAIIGAYGDDDKGENSGSVYIYNMD